MFDAATGATHVLSDFGRAILEALAEFPTGTLLTDFVQRFAEGEAHSADDLLIETVEQAVLEFQRLGLIKIHVV